VEVRRYRRSVARKGPRCSMTAVRWRLLKCEWTAGSSQDGAGCPNAPRSRRPDLWPSVLRARFLVHSGVTLVGNWHDLVPPVWYGTGHGGLHAFSGFSGCLRRAACRAGRPLHGLLRALAAACPTCPRALHGPDSFRLARAVPSPESCAPCRFPWGTWPCEARGCALQRRPGVHPDDRAGGGPDAGRRTCLERREGFLLPLHWGEPCAASACVDIGAAAVAAVVLVGWWHRPSFADSATSMFSRGDVAGCAGTACDSDRALEWIGHSPPLASTFLCARCDLPHGFGLPQPMLSCTLRCGSREVEGPSGLAWRAEHCRISTGSSALERGSCTAAGQCVC